MNASVEVARLLDESGAVLVRHKKHLVYRLPNGQNFISPKTPGDHRTAVNQLSNLRRALAIEPASPNQTQQPPPQGADICAKEHNAMPPTQNATQAPPPPATANVEEPKLCLKERLEAAIREGEAIQEKLMAEAQAAERRVGMLNRRQRKLYGRSFPRHHHRQRSYPPHNRHAWSHRSRS